MIGRSHVSNVACACVIAMCLASDSWAAVTRLPLRQSAAAADAPVLAHEIGAETRPLFASSGRRALAVQPADVGVGGRLFAYGPVSAEAAGGDFTAEILVWEFPRAATEGAPARVGGWRRVALAAFKAATGNTVSATVVDPQLDVGPVITGVFARAEGAPDGRAVTSAPIEVPRGARFGP